MTPAAGLGKASQAIAARLPSMLLFSSTWLVQDRSEVRTATCASDLANGTSNRHSAFDFDEPKDVGFSMHRHAGHLAAGYSEVNPVQ